MDDAILITELNDYIFCPASIYFHKLYGGMDRMLYQSSYQINGAAAHEKVDDATYSTENDVLMAMDVYCEKYNLIGKIDIYNKRKCLLRERKKRIKKVFDGYIYQTYAQCFALREMGYPVNKIELYSMDDHKTYDVDLPENNISMLEGFEKVIEEIKLFQLDTFNQSNREKCAHCIYETACDRSEI